MRTVFLDTVGLLATWDASDQWHAAALQVYETMLAQRLPVITSTFVMLECGNAAARRPYRSTVARFREHMEAAGRLLVPTDDDCKAAWTAYAQRTVADAGIVDHVSFTLMRRMGIEEVFSNDRHFKAAGFQTMF